MIEELCSAKAVEYKTIVGNLDWMASTFKKYDDPSGDTSKYLSNVLNKIAVDTKMFIVNQTTDWINISKIMSLVKEAYSMLEESSVDGDYGKVFNTVIMDLQEALELSNDCT